MRISIVTLGCKTNQAESFGMEGALKCAGHEIVAISDSPDLCIVNTCSVTAKADQQSRQLINKALRNKAKVIATGCYVELNADEINRTGEEIIVFRNLEKNNIVSTLTKSDSSINYNSYPRQRPIVKAQDGCDYSCTYCTIPMARGRSRSESSAKIVDSIIKYKSAGYKEVVLTGIHLGTYGMDLEPKKSLSLLLKRILKESAMPRIRLSSLEIKEIDEELLDIMMDCRICNHLHIPLQSGDDTILKAMNRTYSTTDYRHRIDFIIRKFPDIAIGTDLIAGFPGENEKSFLRSCSFIETMPFSYIHAFPYSSRTGTIAASMKNHTPENVKKERVRILRSISESKRRKYIEGHLNKNIQIIVERKSNEGYEGTSANYIKVLVSNSPDPQEESLINVRVTGYENKRALGIAENN